MALPFPFPLVQRTAGLFCASIKSHALQMQRGFALAMQHWSEPELISAFVCSLSGLQQVPLCFQIPC